MPGMYVVTSIPLVSRTRATLRSAEFGFLGVWVYTRVQTPRFWGQACSAGLAVFQRGGRRPLRTSWLKVGTTFLFDVVLSVTRPDHISAPRFVRTENCDQLYARTSDKPMLQWFIFADHLKPRGRPPAGPHHNTGVARE